MRMIDDDGACLINHTLMFRRCISVSYTVYAVRVSGRVMYVHSTTYLY